jgi:hypothetical protein
MPVEILIDENDTINAIVAVPSVSVEIIAKLVRQGSAIHLEGVHVERLFGGPLDRQQVRLLCAEFCRHYRTTRLVVQGAKRTTGRSAGRIPKAIEFEAPP